MLFLFNLFTAMQGYSRFHSVVLPDQITVTVMK